MIIDRPAPFRDAVEALRAKQLMPTTLTSRDLSALSADLKRRAVFSAQARHAGHVQRMRDLVSQIAGGVTEEDFAARARGDRPLLTSIPEAKAQLQEYLESIGYRPEPGEAGTIKDFTSDRRLQLQIETNLLDVQNHGRWRAGQDPVALEVNPGWELVRVGFPADPTKQRDWPARFQRAGGRLVQGRMVALKNAEIWMRLGDPELFPDGLGNPWAPFAFSSGMTTTELTREECVDLGLMKQSDPAPEPMDLGLNRGVEVTADQFDDALLAELERNPDLYLADDALRIRNAAGPRLAAQENDHG